MDLFKFKDTIRMAYLWEQNLFFSWDMIRMTKKIREK